MALVCKICTLLDGLMLGKPGTDLGTMDGLFQHLEDVHHIPVQRDGETPEETWRRFKANHPTAWPNADCQCYSCRARSRTALIGNAGNN
jgi:hypothetical protein